MNKKILFSSLYLFIILTTIDAQEATVTFITEKDCEVLLFEPIDGGYNERVPQTRLIASNDQPVLYKVKVSPYMFVHCKFSQFQKSCDLILFPGDSLQVLVNNEKVTFKGTNERGLQYWYDNFTSIPFMDGYSKINRIFEEYVSQEREINTVIPTINDSLNISSHYRTIEKLPLTTQTTQVFCDILKTDLHMFYNGFIMRWLRPILNNKKYKIVAAKDSLIINQIIDSIYKYTPIDLELIGYSNFSLYTNNYFSHYFKEPRTEDERTIFGPYRKFLYAPENMQPVLLGKPCLTELKYNAGEMDLQKVKKFFNERFPHSEYTAILNERIPDEAEADIPVSDQFFIKEEIDSLMQLKDVKELRGKYIFIDLWASWCVPCRGEFSYKEQLDCLLDTYNNIVTVYISVDNNKQEKAWLNCIKQYKLNGYHFIASSTLQDDIKQKIYGTENLNIPRYFLISPDGAILHNNLPRPSEIVLLKEALDNILK